jgi:hypothetical protein
MESAERKRGHDVERCRREISDIEALILSGHPDLPGLCLALSDWSAELRILEDEKRRQEDPGGGKGRR